MVQKLPPEKSVSPLRSVLSVMNTMPDPVIAFDSMLKVSFTNPAAQAFFRLTESQILEKYMVELLGTKNAVFEAIENVVRKNLTTTLHDVSVNAKPVGSVIVALVERDLYMMIIRLKPLNISHELGDPAMRVLKPVQELLEEIRPSLASLHKTAKMLNQSQLSAEDHELSALIVEESERIQNLLDQFNFLQEADANQKKTVNLRDVHQHVAQIARETYGDIEIKEYFDPKLPDIRGNFDGLVQANLNLIKNAAEAFANANKKGQISIRTYYDEASGYDPERDENLPLCIEIEDNGQGITPDVLNSIFQPYFTTKKNSYGLGLPITSKIVYDHGGTIKVDSTPGRTVFKINLPLPTHLARK